MKTAKIRLIVNLLLVFILLYVNSISVFASLYDNSSNPDSQEYINGIYQSYYQNPTFANTYASEGSSLVPDTFVKKFSTNLDISKIEIQEQFINDLNESKSLLQLSQFSNEYYALCTQENWGTGTAIVDGNGQVNQVFVGDNGDTYLFDIDTQLQHQLEESGLNLNDTSATFVSIPMYASGIVFSDGFTEYYYPKLIRGGTLITEKLYSIEEIINDIKNNSENILYDEILVGDEHISDDGRVNPPTSTLPISNNKLIQSLSIAIISSMCFLVSLFFLRKSIKQFKTKI